MKRSKSLVILFIAMFCLVQLVGLAACEPLIFTGVTSCGVATNGVSQIELKSVDYKYVISDYPVRSDYAFASTNSTISVTYSFYNGTSSDIVMPLYLVIVEPEYSFDEECDIVSRYQFKTNTEHEIILRCECEPNYYSRDGGAKLVGEFLKRIYDYKQVDDYYNNSLLVYKYTYSIRDLTDNINMIRVKEPQNNKLFLDNVVYHSRQSINSGNYYNFEINDAETLTVYSLAKDFALEDKVTFYNESDEVVDNAGKLTLLSSDEITFDEFAMSSYDEASNLSAIDWYNAILYCFKSDKLNNVNSLYFLDDSTDLTYMYQCNLTVHAQSDVELTVEMPIYPTVDAASYDADVFEYNLDLSSLSNWRGQPDISVSILTEGYFVKASLDLDKTDLGYELNQIDLSTENLSFTLSDVEDFGKHDNEKPADDKSDDIIVAIIIGVFVLVPAVTTWVVIGCDNARRRREKNNSDGTTTTKF